MAMIKNGKFIFTQDRPSAPGCWDIRHGDALEQLEALPSAIARCIVTSPPYYRKVDYGCEGQAGLEETVIDYIDYQQAVAAQLLRVATPDAVMFWVIQDTFNGTGSTGGDYRRADGDYRFKVKRAREGNMPRKAQLLVPERTRIAFADVGWAPILRIPWDKQDSRRGAEDRPSLSYEDVLVFAASESAIHYGHEEILLFAASPDHVWDRNAVLQQYAAKSTPQLKGTYKGKGTRDYAATGQEDPSNVKRSTIKAMKGRDGAYLRAVWDIPSGAQPVVKINGEEIRGSASFPLLLAEICINLGSQPGDLVVDPYAGMGTTILAASQWGRRALGIELNAKTWAAARHRLELEGLGDYRDSKVEIPALDGDQVNLLHAAMG